ncbi:ABC transporter ATP-binding protein/permease [cf. Phormidesmis sp. LEGE 11477]|uniref:ABC transporter ATP-binding protein/permease n=1 Tax=cf. Phormidesmis sp. LEGE 11477 TaxID=1828680 RepID=UPI00187E9911|nr:ABC transporter ATP-binding protein/permease [cf. Phormidesmis sp. LEGE 11477]MBE9060725.1 ABC transporter ATP-binding protein/permease [cf. Phormidesmis sp. LEGE 11477]
MERFNFKVFRRFWAIARPYWIGDEKWKARGLLLLIVVLLLGYTGLSVVLNNQRGELISALSAKSESRFWTTVGIFVGVLVAYAPLLAGYTYLRDRLGLEWRRWLTNSFIGRYFEARSFYQINQFNPEIDNPDQRIAEDVKSFTQESLTLALVVTDSVLEVIAFSGVLWGISQELVLFLVAYAVVGTVLTVGIFGQPLVKLNFEQLKKEANFRFSLVRVRENAEAIAFYQGEEQESNQIKERFLAAFNNYKSLLIWELSLNGLTNFYEFIPFVLPAIVVAPGVFSGDLEVGKVSEAQGAFIRVFFSFNVIVARLQSLTAFGAGIDRLYEFSEAIGYGTTEAAEKEIAVEKEVAVEKKIAEKEITVEKEIGRAEDQNRAEDKRDGATATADQTVDVEAKQPKISFETSGELTLQSLTLQTPNYQRTLIEDLSLSVDGQSSLLVMGPSGCGKSSLMRAIAGLWTSGEGTIARPELEDLLFLPQKPYMILGSLRQQLLYPYPHVEIEDDQLTQVLQQVNLPNLEAQFGLEAEAEWSDVLSLGEQQRLSFARILLHQPKYVVLDEATSALDTANEAQLYDQLAKAKTAYLSVGHRESLKRYHQSLLRLAEDHSWQVLDL